jgi:hypothetical protein
MPVRTLGVGWEKELINPGVTGAVSRFTNSTGSPEEGYDLSTLVNDIGRVVDALKLHRFRWWDIR